VNALANAKVGEYVNDHFFASHQKVGTFQIVNGQKQGGNVATYLCTTEGTVLHAIAGPVAADVFLRELRWAVEVHNKATTESRGDTLKYKLAIRKAHYTRLLEEHREKLPMDQLPPIGMTLSPSESVMRNRLQWNAKNDEWDRLNPLDPPRMQKADKPNAVRVGYLLAAYPLAKLEDVYPLVWTKILKERLSSTPVKVQN
jgi:hypothetical protein